jgi:sortase A
MNKIIVTIVLILMVVTAGAFAMAVYNMPSHSAPGTQVASQVYTPSTIEIPSISMKSSVEQVGLDSQNRMDVPKNWNNVGWYKLGYKPGEGGTAVISGHLDTSTGAPAVFYKLNSVNRGDKIIITDDHGNKANFKVTDKEHYPYNQVPLQKIFNTAGAAALNLITCQGDWNPNQRNYSERLVIYSVKE